MSICGYNEKIGSGLRLLVEGMVDALEIKAANASIDDVLNREIVELKAMIGTMREAGEQTLPAMFVGLNELAKALFEQVRLEMREDSSRTLSETCVNLGESFVTLLAETEHRNQQQQGGTISLNQADNLAVALAQWVLEQSVQRRQCTPVA
jgi:hypothetical protein